MPIHVPQRWNAQKPPLGAMLETGHWLTEILTASGNGNFFVLNEFGGPPRDLVSGQLATLTGNVTNTSWGKGGLQTTNAGYDGFEVAGNGLYTYGKWSVLLGAACGTATGAYYCLAGQGASGGSAAPFRLRTSNTSPNVMRAIFVHSGTNEIITDAANLDQSYHVWALTNDATANKGIFYKDGQLANPSTASVPASTVLGTSPGALYFGRATDGDSINATLYWAMVVPGVALTATQIASLSAAPYQALVVPGRRFYSISGTAYTLTLSETLSLSDGRSGGAAKALSETLSLSDARGAAAAKALVETLSLSDARTAAASKALIETLSLTDTRVADTAKALSESLALSDSRANAVAKGLTESLSLTDARTVAVYKALAETLSLTDVLSFGSLYSLMLTEALTLTDARTATAAKTLTETLPLSDARSASVQKALTEALALTDARTADVAVQLLESLNLTDALSTSGGQILLLLAILAANTAILDTNPTGDIL